MRRGKKLKKAACALFPVVFASLLSGSCGYALSGQGSFLPDHIQTIGVPLFENSTAIFDAEQLLTQQVRSEFIGRGQYTVIPADTEVDALLSGNITGISITPAAFTAQQQASRYILTVRVDIEFLDMSTGEMIWQNPQLTFSDEYEVATGGGGVDAAGFFGQQSNAVQRVARDFARSVVGSILEAF